MMRLSQTEMKVLMARVADAQSMRDKGMSTEKLLEKVSGKYVPGTCEAPMSVAFEVVRGISGFRDTCGMLETEGKDFVKAQLTELTRSMSEAQQCEALYHISRSLNDLKQWVRSKYLKDPLFEQQVRQELRQDSPLAAQYLRRPDTPYTGRLSPSARDSLLDEAAAAIMGQGLTGEEITALMAGPAPGPAILENQIEEDACIGILSVILYGMLRNGEIQDAPEEVTLAQVVTGVTAGRLAAQVREEMRQHRISYTISAQKMETIWGAVGCVLASLTLGGAAFALGALEVESVLLGSAVFLAGFLMLGIGCLVCDTLVQELYNANHVTVGGILVDPADAQSIEKGFARAGAEVREGEVFLLHGERPAPPITAEDEQEVPV